MNEEYKEIYKVIGRLEGFVSSLAEITAAAIVCENKEHLQHMSKVLHEIANVICEGELGAKIIEFPPPDPSEN